MWAQLRRSGIEVARCTLERIMRDNRWRGVMRAANVRTTVADPAEDALTRIRELDGGGVVSLT